MPTPASEAYRQLISLAVHELRTPIGVVSGYLRMLLRDTDEPLTPRQRKMIDEADKSCMRMAAMIAELSDVGKLDAGIITLAQQSLDLVPLIAEVVSQVHEASDRDGPLDASGRRRRRPGHRRPGPAQDRLSTRSSAACCARNPDQPAWWPIAG